MTKRALLISLAIFIILVSLPLTSISQSGALNIYFIDVDQGSATLLVAPHGHSILIDCGDDNMADSVFNVVTNIAQLSAVDYFICTHYHDDHYGSLDKLISNGLSISTAFYDRDSQAWLDVHRTDTLDYKEYANLTADKRSYLRPGTKLNIDPNVAIECIVANGRAKGEYGTITYPAEENGYSLGLVISYEGFDFLIAGDMTSDVEQKLVTRGILPDIDVYQVSHHGAETSSSQPFIDAIKPEVCIVSSGTNGIYKHPRKVIIERLERIPSEVYQLNKNTDESRYPNKIKNVPDSHIGDLDCNGSEGTILIEVSDSIYTVAILDRNLKKTYPVQKFGN